MIAFIISFTTYSQISEAKTFEKVIDIGKVEKLDEIGWIRICRLGYVEDSTYGIRAYSLTFTDENVIHNIEYSPDKVKVFGFTATSDELDYFYEFLKAGFKSDRVKSLEVGDVVIKTLPHSSGFMYINVAFEDGTEGMFKLKKRELDRLFGKR